MATKALLIAGIPLREPVAAQGPFVMNTDAELREGFNEYRTQGDQYCLSRMTPASLKLVGRFRNLARFVGRRIHCW